MMKIILGRRGTSAAACCMGQSKYEAAQADHKHAPVCPKTSHTNLLLFAHNAASRCVEDAFARLSALPCRLVLGLLTVILEGVFHHRFVLNSSVVHIAIGIDRVGARGNGCFPFPVNIQSHWDSGCDLIYYALPAHRKSGWTCASTSAVKLSEMTTGMGSRAKLRM